MEELKLNLGCGVRKLDGYVNVDKFGSPDLMHDLEVFPWPWQTDSVSKIKMVHVLEHLGQAVDVYFGVIKELYRVCCHGASIQIVVPHHRHRYFYDDPTHVRVVTPMGLMLFSKRMNRQWLAEGKSNTPLGLHLEVDLELKSINAKPSKEWHNLYPDSIDDLELLKKESEIYNNLIEQFDMELEVVKE